MGVKHSFKQILALMASKRAYCRVLSVVLTVVMTLQLAVVPARAALWFKQDQEDPVAEGTEEGGVTAPEQELRPTEPTLKNTFADPRTRQTELKERSLPYARFLPHAY